MDQNNENVLVKKLGLVLSVFVLLLPVFFWPSSTSAGHYDQALSPLPDQPATVSLRTGKGTLTASYPGKSHLSA